MPRLETEADPDRTPSTVAQDRPAERLDPRTAARLESIWARAYAAADRAALESLYAEWAASYDADHAAIGFHGHRVAAGILARYCTRREGLRVLDAGAGTGAAGEALHALGFDDLTAVDLSPEMLAVARAKGVYRETHAADLSVPLDRWPQDTFDAAILVGVFSYGQAPALVLDEVVRLVRPGGVVALTLRTDFAEQDPMGIAARLEELEREGALRLLERSAAHPYLPLVDPEARFRVWTYRVLVRTASDAEEGFERAVREALERADPVVELDHHWIWDSRASELYERYTRSDGYYLTDCEESILRAHADAIHGDEPLIVELGCGSARKIAHVLEARLAAAPEGALTYLPIDVSRGAVRETEAAVLERFGERVAVEPRMGLFEQVLGSIPRDRRKLVFFFGSSIGNFHTLEETVGFLRELGRRLAPGDRLIVGTDLHKELDVLERAYNEEETCRQFFVHMLRRVNEHLGADFDPRVFELASTYELEPEWRGLRTRRMNLRVRPRVPQRTFVQGLRRETLLDEETPVQVGVSRKFEPGQVLRLGELAGLRPGRQWLDARGWFALTELLGGDDERADGAG